MQVGHFFECYAIDNEKEKINTHKDQIYRQAVLSKAMPIVNSTNMTDQEREQLGVWIEAN